MGAGTARVHGEVIALTATPRVRVLLHLEHGDDALLDVAALGGGLRGRGRVRVREARPRIMVSLKLHVLTWEERLMERTARCHCGSLRAIAVGQPRISIPASIERFPQGIGPGLAARIATALD